MPNLPYGLIDKILTSLLGKYSVKWCVGEVVYRTAANVNIVDSNFPAIAVCLGKGSEFAASFGT